MGTHDTHDSDNRTPRDDEPQLTNDDMSLALIEEQAERSIRRVWHDGRWFFSVIDVIGVLTDAPKPRQYWNDMKRYVHTEGFQELSEAIRQLKMRAADGKMRETDAADTKTLLRIIQSVPSPKAEPIKQWLARVGAQRLDAVTRPLDGEQIAAEIAALRKPAPDAPALAWAEHFEQLAALYRRQAAYDRRLAYVDARVSEQNARLSAHDGILSEHETQIGELHSRMESLELGQRMLADLPELLEKLGPRTLSPEHQRTIQRAVKRLHEVSGAAYPTIYTELGEHFHVAKYTQIPEERWEEVAAWFKQRIDAAEKRRQR